MQSLTIFGKMNGSSSARLTSLKPLSRCPMLQELSIGHSTVDHLRYLENCIYLKKLNISGSKVRDSLHSFFFSLLTLWNPSLIFPSLSFLKIRFFSIQTLCMDNFRIFFLFLLVCSLTTVLFIYICMYFLYLMYTLLLISGWEPAAYRSTLYPAHASGGLSRIILFSCSKSRGR